MSSANAAAGKREKEPREGEGEAKRMKPAAAEAEAKAEPKEGGEDEMAAMLGFASFGTTKGHQVDDNVRGPARGGKAHTTVRKATQMINLKKENKNAAGKRGSGGPGSGGGAGRGRGGGGGGRGRGQV